MPRFRSDARKAADHIYYLKLKAEGLLAKYKKDPAKVKEYNAKYYKENKKSIYERRADRNRSIPCNKSFKKVVDVPVQKEKPVKVKPASVPRRPRRVKEIFKPSEQQIVMGPQITIVPDNSEFLKCSFD